MKNYGKPCYNENDMFLCYISVVFFYLELGIHGLLERNIFSLLPRVHSLAGTVVGFFLL